MKKPSVTFWQVMDSKQKVGCVCQLVHLHFHQAQRQIITVPNQQAAEYLDRMLWHYPKESFVPHAITTAPLAAAVVITTAQANLNEAQVLINLCAGVSPVSHTVGLVHELWDKTDAAKEELSRQRHVAYETAGYTVTIAIPTSVT